MTMRSNRQMDLPDMICFRVTRDCNARCRFCLAPPEGNQPSAATLISRIDWLLERGVKTIHFCGGEPTVHSGIAELLTHVHSIGARSRLTTNGISLPANLAAVLRTTNTAVKVSLHGDKDHHNDIMGVKSFHHTTRNIKRLLAEGVDTSIQATVVAQQFWVIDWLAEFCVASGVRRLSLLPFIPRGDGMNCRDEFAMTTMERSTLRTLVKRKRQTLNGRLDIRWLDFNTQPIHVVEADGRVVLEAATGTMDEVLDQIPAPESSTHSIHFQASSFSQLAIHSA